MEYSENEESESELLGPRPLQESQQTDEDAVDDPPPVHQTDSHTGSRRGEV